MWSSGDGVRQAVLYLRAIVSFVRRGSWHARAGATTLKRRPRRRVVGDGAAISRAWVWFGPTFASPLNLTHECTHRLRYRQRKFVGFPRTVGSSGRSSSPDSTPTASGTGPTTGTWAPDGDTNDAYLVDIRGAGFLRLLTRSCCSR
jgi:hypothetical protein